MKSFAVLFAFFFISFSSIAQKTIQLRNLWSEPQVKILFQGYTIFFTFRDINRALELLVENGVPTYGSILAIDTSKTYVIELYPGYRQEYHRSLQPMIQLAVGAFLLTKGRAIVTNPKHKKLKSITVDIEPVVEGENETGVKFYDPATGKLIFSGRLPEAIKNADIGIDYW